MKKDSRSRKWLITINNPVEKGFTKEVIIEKLGSMKSIIYYCFADEIGEKGTPHTHIFLAASNAIRFSTLQKKFEGAHFDMCKGTSVENRNYVFKEGKWEKHKKKETHLEDTRVEWGDLPVERQGQRNDLHDLYDMIKSGYTNYEILEVNPDYILQLDKLDRIRQIFKEEKYKNVWRDIKVEYIYGDTGTGKTRGVMEKYGYENVYRVTDYGGHPWDNYAGQDVVIFEEFRSSFKITDMLNYLDGYPLTLRARYNQKIACFTKVYIISNIGLYSQYEEIQEKDPVTFNALKRRIDKVVHYTNGLIGLIKEYSVEDCPRD